jgi:hypothetical protein
MRAAAGALSGLLWLADPQATAVDTAGNSAGSSAGADAAAAAQKPNASRRPRRAAARANVAAATYAAGDDDEEQDTGPCQSQRAPARKRPAAAVTRADLPDGGNPWQQELIKTLRSQQKAGKVRYGHLQLK